MIRKAKQGDGKYLKELHTASAGMLCAGNYTSHQLSVLTSGDATSFEKIISKSPFFIVSESDQIDGFLSLKPDFSIWQLYVHPSKVRLGIGRTLLGSAENHMIDLGIQESRVVSTVNAAPFYERCGYRLIGEGKVTFSGVDLLVMKMKKVLPAAEPS